MAKLIDKTVLFRDLLKDVQAKMEVKPDKQRILKRKERDPMAVKAQVIIDHTSKLKEFLNENRSSYIDVMNRNYSSSALTDLERDKIDAGANALIRTINGLVDEFKKDLKSRMISLKGQHFIHLEAVSDLLDADLKLACQKFSEQRAIRVKNELEIQKLSRLEIKARKTQDHGSLASFDEDNSEISQKPPEIVWTQDDDEGEEDSHQLSPEEMQLFEQENEKMYKDLMSLRDDVQQIESKVVKIAELQEIFTEKVLQQKDDIDLIAANAVAATENVKDGNEEIRKAIRRNASIRVYILFFLLVMSFTLLFLDWYNE